MKNVFELKNARNVLVYGNILERSWVNGQTGYVVLLTVRNQGGNCTWCIVNDVEMSYNIIRHGTGGIQVIGQNDDPTRPSARTGTLWIHDNLFYDINSSWGGSVSLFQIGHAPHSMVIDHNTADHPNHAQLYFYGPLVLDSLTLTNNLLQRGSYGVFGANTTEGTQTLNGYATSWTFQKNAVAGASLRAGSG